MNRVILRILAMNYVRTNIKDAPTVVRNAYSDFQRSICTEAHKY